MTYLPKYRWSYGITAVPERGDNLLKQALESLATAGFGQPALFVDGLSENWVPPSDLVSSLVIRHPKVGPFANWCCSLLQLYLTNPKSDYFAIFEDDLLACSSLFQYLEATIPSPEFPKKCYWNLATHDQNVVLSGGRPGWYPSNQKGRGAVALVFPRTTVQALLSSDFLVKVPGNSNTDGCIINALAPLGFTEYVHYPTLVDHLGEVSSIGHSYGRFKSWPYDGWNPFEYEGLK